MFILVTRYRSSKNDFATGLWPVHMSHVCDTMSGSATSGAPVMNDGVIVCQCASVTSYVCSSGGMCGIDSGCVACTDHARSCAIEFVCVSLGKRKRARCAPDYRDFDDNLDTWCEYTPSYALRVVHSCKQATAALPVVQRATDGTPVADDGVIVYPCASVTNYMCSSGGMCGIDSGCAACRAHALSCALEDDDLDTWY